MSIKKYLIISTLLLSGCTAGNAEIFRANVSSYNCGDFTIQPEGYFNSGYEVIYYIIPLIVLGPDFETANSLEVPISIYSRQKPVSDSDLDRVVVYVNGSSQAIAPYKIEVTAKNEISSKPWYFKRYLFYFQYDRDKVESYKFNFPKDFHDCIVPDIVYKKHQE